MKQIILPLVAAIALMGCESWDSMSTSQQRVLGGTLGGAGGGALIGAMAGNAGMGAAVGAGAGLVGGLLYDHYKTSEESAYQRGYSEGAAGAPPPAQ